MTARGSNLARVVCWYCANEWLARIGKGMARCPSCRTYNHLPSRRAGVA